MKKVIFCWLLIVAPIILFAQEGEKLNHTDAKGMKQGHWIAKYDNGAKKYDGYFKDNKPVGLMKRYFDDGSLKAELDYKKNGIIWAKLYYQDGNLAATGKYIGNQKDSVWRYYSYYGKYLSSEVSYKNNKKHGVSRVFYSNGKVSEELEWENDKKHGVWKQYFDNGKLLLESAYLNDKRTGPYFYFFPDGKYESTGFFKNDDMHGWWTYYNEDGTVRVKVEYVDGLPKDPSVLQKAEEEFFKKIEQNKGKYQEPTEEDLLPVRNRK